MLQSVFLCRFSFHITHTLPCLLSFQPAPLVFNTLLVVMSPHTPPTTHPNPHIRTIFSHKLLNSFGGTTLMNPSRCMIAQFQNSSSKEKKTQMNIHVNWRSSAALEGVVFVTKWNCSSERSQRECHFKEPSVGRKMKQGCYCPPQKVMPIKYVLASHSWITNI